MLTELKLLKIYAVINYKSIVIQILNFYMYIKLRHLIIYLILICSGMHTHMNTHTHTHTVHRLTWPRCP